jgi:hypothetical protein
MGLARVAAPLSSVATAGVNLRIGQAPNSSYGVGSTNNGTSVDPGVVGRRLGAAY